MGADRRPLAVLAFMMSVIALSLPELVILRKFLKMPLIARFAAVVASGIVLADYLFDAALQDNETTS